MYDAKRSEAHDTLLSSKRIASRKSFSGEIFPGRRHSVERAVDAFISSTGSHRLGVPSTDQSVLRRASLQTEPRRHMGNVRILTPNCSPNEPSSPGRSVRRSPMGSSELTSVRTEGHVGRRVSYATGTRQFSARDVIFDIGSDYMKVQQSLRGSKVNGTKRGGVITSEEIR